MSKENDRFKKMVENSPDVFWEFDENANFTYVSPGIKDLLGYEPEELIGLNAFDLMNPHEAERVHRHFDPIAKRYLPFKNLENTNIHKNGHEIVIESSGTPIFSEEGQFRGYRGIDRSITERKAMEENYRLFSSLTSDYVHYCIRSGKSEYQVKWIGGAVNPISGYSVNDVLKLGCFLPLIHPDDRQRVSDYLLSLVPGDNKSIEFRIITQQKEIRWVSEKSQCKEGLCEDELILLGAVTDITERKRSEEHLRESEEHFKNIAEMLPEAVFEVDLQGNLSFASRRAFELFGLSKEDIEAGLCAFDLLVPTERALADERFRKRVSGEVIGAFEYTALRKDGSTFPVILNVTPIIKGGKKVSVLAIMTDIAERKLAEDSMKKNQEFLNETQGIAKLGSWQFDAETKQVTWSKETYRIYGETSQTIVPSYQAYLDLVHPDDRAFVEEIYSKSLKECSESTEFEHRIVRKKTGEIRHIHCKCKHEFNPQGSRIRTIGMVQDITERKTSEMALQLATQAAESANRAKSVFLAKVSHEIRTPLTAIVGFGELLEDAELAEKDRKFLSEINTASSTLSNLINDILDLSKIEAGKLPVKPKEFSLRDLIVKVLATQEQQIKKKNLLIDISIDTDVPDLVIGDQLRIQQVLLNLIGNAVKFTEKGNIDIATSVVEDSGLRVLLDIAVIDTGVGISADLQEHIFEPFTQVLDYKTPNQGGSGLGLTISQGLAGLMGGSVSVESQEGVGSTFHFLIPLQKKKSNLLESSTSVKESSFWTGPALNILLAEDNPINSNFIKTALKNMGHLVTVAENGKVVLDALKENIFDLVLMDIQMPVMNGTDVLGVIREQEKTTGKHLGVIALTAYALVGDKEKYLKMGFDGYLRKPFKTDELIDEMVRLVPS